MEGTIAAWASENSMKLIGGVVAFPGCERAYQIDTQYNNDLTVAMKLLGSGRPDLMNGKRRIGGVCWTELPNETVALIYPEIRDR